MYSVFYLKNFKKMMMKYFCLYNSKIFFKLNTYSLLIAYKPLM